MATTPALQKINFIGLQKLDYKGNDSTLCAGCGHDSIASQIITACFESGVKPENVIKLSGIGCSSKSPAYFMNRAWGFNTLHGRMAAVATGATTANHKLTAIGEYWEVWPHSTFFLILSGLALAMAVLLLAILKPLKKALPGV